jgi:3'(2'), 5'-bisphosphate nucleotidase
LDNKLVKHPAALINILKRIALEAGEITLDFFEDSGQTQVDKKSDGSPVTLADQAAEKHIESALSDLIPDIPMVGEEAFSEGRVPDLEKSEYFWLVDPLDGTKEFISGRGDYTVNIALIHKGDPVIGVVYAPVKGELYSGHGENTAKRWLQDTDTEKSIRVRKPPGEGLTVVASLSHGNSEELETFLKSYKVKKLIKRGSSLKICAVAAGKADLYPRLGPTCEWDTAAGDAVIRSAGGVITDLNGIPLKYGYNTENFLNPKFLAQPSVELNPS